MSHASATLEANGLAGALRRVRYPLAAVAVALFIVGEILLHLPPKMLPRIGVDKLLHVICYGGFTGLTLLLLSVFAGWTYLWRSTSGLAMVAAALVALAVLGYVDELTQPLTGRRFQWSDLAADIVGIVLCAALFALLARWGTSRRLEA